MSLINKMLQDLDKRHAGDGGGKPLTQQLRPVKTASKDWRRIMLEIGAGLIVGAGWAGWVYYQIAPRSVVTELAFRARAQRLQGSCRAPGSGRAAAAAARSGGRQLRFQRRLLRHNCRLPPRRWPPRRPSLRTKAR